MTGGFSADLVAHQRLGCTIIYLYLYIYIFTHVYIFFKAVWQATKAVYPHYVYMNIYRASEKETEEKEEDKKNDEANDDEVREG